MLHTGGAGHCRCSDAGEAVCTASAQALKQASWLPSSRRIAFKANVSAMRFQARQGTVSNTGSIDIASADGAAAIRHVISIAASVRSCTPNGQMKPLPKC